MGLIICLQLLHYTLNVCTLENIALGKPVWEDRPWQGTENWRGDRAVDGRYTNRSAAGGQCVINENYGQTATWRVDLGGVVSISHINIYYRAENKSPSPYTKRMAGFFLYVSKTTSKDDGHLCFHEIQTVEGTPSEDQSINCSVNGRYVIYYNERLSGKTYPSYYSKFAHYELCELEVYGCDGSMYYGPDCTAMCSENCVGNRCNVRTGHCLSCSPGYHGYDCSTPCPNNCRNKKCDVNTGHCFECVPGYHGSDCTKNCPFRCRIKTCSMKTGDCLSCIPGYQGPTCTEVCKAQTFGANCSQSCGNCSDGETCHHVNGTCLHGCDEGVQGLECKTVCQPGHYGRNCEYTCSENCKMVGNCDRFSGECSAGCKAGWKGKTCNSCSSVGYYGPNCSIPCSTHCQGRRCDVNTGIVKTAYLDIMAAFVPFNAQLTAETKAMATV